MNIYNIQEIQLKWSTLNIFNMKSIHHVLFLSNKSILTFAILFLSIIVCYSQIDNFVISVGRKSDAHPIYNKEAKRYNQKYINPTGYEISIRSKEPLEIENLIKQISAFEKTNKPTAALEAKLERLLASKGLQSSTFSVEGKTNSFVGTGSSLIEVPNKGIFKIVGVAKYQDGSRKNLNTTIKILDFLLVVMGDSYISGEGNPDKLLAPSAADRIDCEAVVIKAAKFDPPSNNQEIWQEGNAHRSFKNSAFYASQMIEGKIGSTYTLVRFVSFARSGARIVDGLIQPNTVDDRDNYIQMGQVDEAVDNIRNTNIDALILSISGNDVEFVGTLKELLVGQLDAKNDTERARREKKFNTLLLQIPSRFDLLAAKLKKLKIKNVLINEYPVRLFESVRTGKVVDATPCGIFTNSFSQISLEKDDGILFKKLGKQLNETIKTTAEKHGWHYVDGIDKSFTGHGYCAPDTYYVGAEESCLNQDDIYGIAHPNVKGHKAISKVIYQHLKPIIDELSKSIDNDDLPTHKN